MTTTRLPPAATTTTTTRSKVPQLDLTYDDADSQASARALVYAIRPRWARSHDGGGGGGGGNLTVSRLTEGRTNILLKITHREGPKTSRPEQHDAANDDDGADAGADEEAVLLRAYGNHTDILIDREREAQNHELLMGFGLAPELLARFRNGMLYRYIRGSVTAPADLRRRDVWGAVARRIAEWHARVPCLAGEGTRDPVVQRAIDHVAPGKIVPNIWSVMQKWVYALPTGTEEQRQLQATIQKELLRTVSELSQRPGFGENSLVFGHCDLLSGNIIMEPTSSTNGHMTNGHPPLAVSFIDYEYAVPAPAAFDIANHLAEWGGFECDFAVLPTRSQRRDFLDEYIQAYFSYFPARDAGAAAVATAVDELCAEVDLFRGVPGLYWSLWALIQAQISQIDFDYATYADLRLGEYWAWRAEQDGSRAARGEEMGVRERRWAEE